MSERLAERSPTAVSAPLPPAERNSLTEEPACWPGRIQTALALLALLIMLVHRLGGSVVDLDVWHEMAVVRKAVELGRFPYRDHFSYMPTVNPSVHHEWGAGAILYGLSRQFGGTSLVVLRFALVLGLAGLTWRNARRLGGSTGVNVMLSPIVILLAGKGFATVRAQLYTYLFLAIFVWFCQLDRQGKRWWAVPWLVIYVAWVNLHAGVLTGAGLFFFYWLEQLLRRQPHRHLLAIGLVMFPLAMATPYTWHYYPYLYEAVLLERPNVAEWNNLWEDGDPMMTGLFLFSLAIYAYALAARGWQKAAGWPQVAITALAAASAVRMLPIYGIIWMAYVPGYLSATSVGEFLRSFWKNNRAFHLALWSACAIWFAIQLWPAEPWRLRVPGTRIAALGQHKVYPVGAMRYLKEQQFAGNLMVGFDWGAYILWKLDPDVKVSMDGRYEVAYPPSQADENVQFFLAEPGWEQMLEREHYCRTDLILVPTFLPLAKVIGDLEGWKPVYRDPSFELYAREDSTLPTVHRETAVLDGEFP